MKYSLNEKVLLRGTEVRVVTVVEKDPWPYTVQFNDGANEECQEYELTELPVQPAAPSITNGQDPKAKFGATKPSYGLCSGVSDALTALAMEDGARKYGAFNFRENTVEVMTYAHACLRHIKAWIDREDFTSDTGVPNLGAARACLDIIMDASAAGTAVDNRPVAGGSSKVQDAAKDWKKAVAAGENPIEAAKRLLAPAMGVKP